MPSGRVQRIDERRQTAYIVREGRTYVAPLSEVETKARVPSARVRFELLRRDGSETASKVRLRSGTRTNSRHRRFGDLTGAARPGAKVQTVASRSYGIDVTTQPFRVAGSWLQVMSEQNYDGAASLYLPEATVHTASGLAEGHNQIRAVVERLPLIEADEASVDMRGIDCYVRIGYRAEDADHTTYLIIDRGSIVEQWLDLEPEVPAEKADRPVELVCRGDIPDQAREYAADKITHLAERTGHRLRSARIKLSMAENPKFDQPAVVEASLEFNTSMVRARGSAQTLTEAIDMLVARLGARIEHQQDRQRHRPVGLQPLPGTWRHGNLARPETPFFNRPVEEREIVRHKSFAPEEMTIDEAAWDMALLDYDFFLFVESETGLDSLLEDTNGGPLILHQLDGVANAPHSTVTDIEASDSAPPRLAISRAIELLDATGNRMQFVVNDVTGRGNVVYRRMDGHYGLITPSDDEI